MQAFSSFLILGDLEAVASASSVAPSQLLGARAGVGKQGQVDSVTPPVSSMARICRKWVELKQIQRLLSYGHGVAVALISAQDWPMLEPHEPKAWRDLPHDIFLTASAARSLGCRPPMSHKTDKLGDSASMQAQGNSTVFCG